MYPYIIYKTDNILSMSCWEKIDLSLGWSVFSFYIGSTCCDNLEILKADTAINLTEIMHSQLCRKIAQMTRFFLSWSRPDGQDPHQDLILLRLCTVRCSSHISNSDPWQLMKALPSNKQSLTTVLNFNEIKTGSIWIHLNPIVIVVIRLICRY